MGRRGKLPETGTPIWHLRESDPFAPSRSHATTRLGILLPDDASQQRLFSTGIERVSRLGSARPVPIPNSSDAAWVQDASGRDWVIKWEESTGFQPLLAEALCWLLGQQLGVLQPAGAVFLEGERRAWLSKRVPQVAHWDASRSHFLTNPSELGAMLALDAIAHNADRRSDNILLQPSPDELHLRAFAIDSGNALIGWSDFYGLGLQVPEARNLAPGLPIDLLTDGVLAAASKATALKSGQILAMVTEACEIARDPGKVALHQALLHRLEQAPALVTDYLRKLTLVSKPQVSP